MEHKQALTIEEKHGGTVLWLNQPQKKNVISVRMLNELTDFFTKSSGNNQFVVIAARGDCFSAGADLSEMMNVSEAHAREISKYLHNLLLHIGKYPAPVIAAVHGYAIGGGFELALGADMIYATETAWFGMPETDFSLIPGGGATQQLPMRLGRADAFYYIFSGDKITAKQCMARGLVQKLFSEDEFIEQVLQSISAKSSRVDPAAIATLKKTIRMAGHADGYAAESEGFAWLLVHKAKPLINQFMQNNKSKGN